MTQTSLPFQYEVSEKETGQTSLSGLPLYLDLMNRMGLERIISENIKAREKSQGWTDSEMIKSLILLNLAGGDCVSDLQILEGDEGFRRLLNRMRMHGLSRKERRELERRWRKERKRSTPSESSVFRYLSLFHDPQQEKLRPESGAFIPAPNDHLQGFRLICGAMAGFAYNQNPETTATLDMDATLVESRKETAGYCYKKFPAYHRLMFGGPNRKSFFTPSFGTGTCPRVMSSCGYWRKR